ncbi:hypothetical protein [Cytobacillus purgationiresistens]|uniref:DUF4025 domain-containing protein n=1 Tax=Cytobacillus purgationiresistens TaxID=863449 RepID=A0ABU0ANV9_9BACI|nr:hypothetical protein [Cytobacillus purgationiresistens]MDQ0272088.1 hypothetical protein [Cytobacillus purgationiresistens]
MKKNEENAIQNFYNEDEAEKSISDSIMEAYNSGTVDRNEISNQENQENELS